MLQPEANGDFVDISTEHVGNASNVSSNQENLASQESNGMPAASFNMAWPQIKSWLQSRRASLRPWVDFVRVANFDVPTSPAAAGKRVIANVQHFQSNYVLVFVVLLLYCLLTSPLLLIVLAMAMAACYFLSARQQERRLVLGGKEISLAQQFTAVGLCTIPLLVLVGAGSAVFWVLGASFFVIFVHASFYNLELLQIETASDQQQLTGSIVQEV